MCTVFPKLSDIGIPRCQAVIPCHTDDVLWKLFDGLWMCSNDIAPEHWSLSDFLYMLAYAVHPLNIHRM